jgi:hypothetical protein
MSSPYNDIVKAFDEYDGVSKPNVVFMSREMWDTLNSLPKPNAYERFMAWLQWSTPYPIRKIGFWLEHRYVDWWDFRIRHGWVRKAEK